MKVKPLHKNVLLTLETAPAQEAVVGALILPTAAPKQLLFRVLEVSENVSIVLEKGDLVVLCTNHGAEIDVDGVKCRIVDESAIAGVVYG